MAECPDSEENGYRLKTQSELASLTTRVAVVESNQEFFRESVLTQLVATTENEKMVANKLDRMTRALASVPKDISTQVTSCQEEMLTHLQNAYAEKSEVVTAKSLRNTLILVAVLVTLLGTGINWLLEETVLKYRLELERERGIHSQFYEPKSGVWHESGQSTCGLPTICI